MELHRVRRFEAGAVALFAVGALVLGGSGLAHAGPVKRKALSVAEVRKDLELICHVEKLAGGPPGAPDKAARIAEYLQRKVKSQQAWDALSRAAESRGDSVREAVKKFGLDDDCPFLQPVGGPRARPPDSVLEFRDLISDAKLAISPDGSLSADTMTPNVVSVRDARTKALRFAIPFDQGASEMKVYFGAVRFSTDGRRLIVFSALMGNEHNPSLTTVIDLATGEKKWTHRTQDVLGGVVSPDGSHVAYTLDPRLNQKGSRTVVVKNVESGGEKRCDLDVPQDNYWRQALALTTSGRRLAYVKSDRVLRKVTLQLIDPQSCATLHSWESTHDVACDPAPVFSPNDELVALRTSSVLRVWNVASGAQVLEREVGPQCFVAYAPDRTLWLGKGKNLAGWNAELEPITELSLPRGLEVLAVGSSSKEKVAVVGEVSGHYAIVAAFWGK